MYYEGDTLKVDAGSATSAIRSDEMSDGNDAFTTYTPDNNGDFLIPLLAGLNLIQLKKTVNGVTSTVREVTVNAKRLQDPILKSLLKTRNALNTQIEDVETRLQKSFSDNSGMNETNMDLTELIMQRNKLNVSIAARKKSIQGEPIARL